MVVGVVEVVFGEVVCIGDWIVVVCMDCVGVVG